MRVNLELSYPVMETEVEVGLVERVSEPTRHRAEASNRQVNALSHLLPTGAGSHRQMQLVLQISAEGGGR